jgi:hypothetical protein
MEMRMGVNESRDESEEEEEEEEEDGYGNEEEEEVSTFEDMNYMLDTFEYEVDFAGDLGGMGFDSCRYSDDLRMLVLESVEDDVLADGLNNLKCCEILDDGGLDIDTSGQLASEILPLEYLLVVAGVVMDADTYT